MPPLVSIIIPAYNVAAYLPECMQSILLDAEALGYEVLLMDDGSADETPALCDGYAARCPFVRVFHQPNAGQAAARNAAIRAAAGEWLVFVDSDDTLAPGALRTIDAALRAAPPQADLLLYNLYSEANGGLIAPFAKAQFAGGIEGYLARAVREVPFSAALCRYAPRRTLFTEQGLWLHEGIYHEDSEWCPRALARARAAVVCEEPLYHYRDTAAAGHESTMLSPGRRQKRLDSLAQVTRALAADAALFEGDETRRTFLLRCAALCGFQRMLLAGRCGVLKEVPQEDRDLLYELESYLPRRFGLCVKLAGLTGGTRLYRRLWGDC